MPQIVERNPEKGRGVPCEGTGLKYEFVRKHHKEYKITRMREVLGVSTSGYYDWLDRPESNRSRENRMPTEKITHFHQQSRGIYGSPKIHRDLVAEGETRSENRVARLMRAADIKSKLARQFVITTDSNNTLQPAPDLLQRQFKVDRRDKVWVSDTTFIAAREGWLYVAVKLDLFSRHVIGWAMSERMMLSLFKTP